MPCTYDEDGTSQCVMGAVLTYTCVLRVPVVAMLRCVGGACRAQCAAYVTVINAVRN